MKLDAVLCNAYLTMNVIPLITAYCLHQEKGDKLIMKASVLLFLSLSVLFHNSSCSNGVQVNNSDMPNSNIAQVAENQTGSIESSQSNQIVESNTPANLKDVVAFDGKNYIKKSGWETPSKKNAYIDESYDQGNREGVTKSGKRVRTKESSYSIAPPWQYSQNFIYKGRELDYLKGKLISNNFLETSVNDKVFLYWISAQNVGSPPPSNNEPHEDPFVYEIMDSDGDGIFETLLGDYDEIIVPNWVLN